MNLHEAARALGFAADALSEQETLGLMKRTMLVGQGAARQYVRDVRELPPEVVRIDHLRFEARITAAGAISDDAVAVTVPQGFDFILKRVLGYIQEAANDQMPDNWARILFQAREEGRTADVFTSRISMAELLGTLSPAEPLVFDRGIYRFAGGHKIAPEFTLSVAADGPGAWVASTNPKVVGVAFIGDLVISKLQP